MTAAVKNHLLLVLEQAARDEFMTYFKLCPLTLIQSKCDASASTYGAGVPRICWLTGWSADRVRYNLAALVVSGEVIKHQCRHGGPVAWWPVGLIDKLRKEIIG